MELLRTVIRHFDDWLSIREGVLPFTDDPRVILRLQAGRVNHDLDLPDSLIPPGAKVLYLHLWNERMPRIPDAGPDPSYGLKLERLIVYSLKAAAQHVQSTQDLYDVEAIGGITVLVSLKAMDGARAMFEQLGFTVMHYRRPLGAFGEFWENFYTWWLMWTYNPASVHHRSLWNLQRSEFWMTRQLFLKRYA